MATSSIELPVSDDARLADRPAHASSIAGHPRPHSGVTASDPLPTTARRTASEWLRPGIGTLRAGIGRFGSRAITGLAVLVLLFAVGLFAFRAAYGERIYPAVYVADVDLGGMTREEARAVLAAQAEEIERGLVTFSHDGEIWTPSLTQLGVTVDVDASVDAAYTVGREKTAADRLGTTSRLVHKDRRLPLVLQVDEAVLVGWFDQVQADLGQLPHDAFLVVEGTTVRIEPAVEGTTVDRTAAREIVSAALSGLSPVFAPLPLTPWVARVHADDLVDAQAKIEQALARPVDVEFEDRTWTVAPEDFGRFVVQQTSPDLTLTGSAAVVVGVDETALSSWLNERFGPEVNRAPVEAEVGWNGDRVIPLSDSIDGARLRPKSFGQDLTASYFGDHQSVAIAVSVLPPAVSADNVDALGITTHLARGDSNYDSGGGATRDLNIVIGTDLLNGTLIPPHGEFSFNHAIGEITADKGYVESSVVVAERVGRDIGGGICQVSTTMFRAALLAGLPITEWWPHTYQILQYEHEGWGPGFDASILQPEGDPFGGGDFKFLNPTDAWMLVEAWTTGVHVVVNIYGPDLGYTVEFSDTFVGELITEGSDMEIVDWDLPAGTINQTEFTISGREVSFTRFVYDANGELVEEREFYTRFKGRGNVYQVSPDMAGQSPASY